MPKSGCCEIDCEVEGRRKDGERLDSWKASSHGRFVLELHALIAGLADLQGLRVSLHKEQTFMTPCTRGAVLIHSVGDNNPQAQTMKWVPIQ